LTSGRVTRPHGVDLDDFARIGQFAYNLAIAADAPYSGLPPSARL